MSTEQEKIEESKESIKFKQALLLTTPPQLPLGIYALFFGNRTVAYKSKVLISKIIMGPSRKLQRGVIVGDYIYIPQDMSEQSYEGSLARAGHNILHIFKRSTKKEMGKVVNGKVVRINV